MSDHLLPPSASPLEKAAAGAGRRMSAVDAEVIRRNRQPLACDAAFLPFLCWERSTRRFAPGDDSFNRARAQNAFAEHALAGTPVMLEAEIGFDLGYRVDVREWFEAGLAWPGFEVLVALEPDRAPPTSGDVLTSVMTRKNVRDIPLISYQAPPAGVVVGAALAAGATIQILPEDPDPRLEGGVVYGAALWVAGDIEIRPMQ